MTHTTTGTSAAIHPRGDTTSIVWRCRCCTDHPDTEMEPGAPVQCVECGAPCSCGGCRAEQP